jgi:hemoglobin
MKSDIKNRTDIEDLVKTFYEKLLHDDDMSPLFVDVTGDHLAAHFDILYDFWESVLFFTGQYKRNAMLKHIELHDKYGLTKAHFTTWLSYFNQTVDDLFEGEKADLAKQRAKSIAVIMEMKINEIEKQKGNFENKT